VVIEVAELRVQPGRQAEFEEAIRQGLTTLIAAAKGAEGYTLLRCVEDPELYLMQIRWESIQAHLVDYREGPLSQQFRALCRPFFAQPATMQHFDTVIDGG
jgi:quinol monooxygenase YgiN